MNSDGNNSTELARTQVAALARSGARTLAVRGRDLLQRKEEAAEWLRKGLELRDVAPNDPRVRGPINPYAVTPPNDETKFRNAIEYVRLIKLGDSAEAAAMKLHMTSEDLEFAKTAHFFMPDTLAKFAHDEERRIQDVLLKREKMLDEAYQCFVKGNSLDPLNTELMYHLANALKQAYDSAPESDEECQPYLERSFALFRQAAALGHTESLFELGNQYSGRDTTLVKVDHEQATELYRMAAEKGHLMAHVILAECYAHGIGVNQDDEMAAYLSLKASNLEDENA